METVSVFPRRWAAVWAAVSVRPPWTAGAQPDTGRDAGPDLPDPDADGERVSNIVIMGSGEPLDNYDNVIRFLRMITDENGLNISQRNITLSTCGIVPNILRLAEENIQITLACPCMHRMMRCERH